jgi:FMN phosphatase YigB (HAD superfamily)
MLALVMAEATLTANWRLPRTLHAFRRYHERLGRQQASDYLSRLYRLTAEHCHCTPAEVRAIVEEWMERRPLPHLLACRYPGIDRLFEALAAKGKTIAILSDYPARAKIEALGLKADLIVAATDPEVGQLKPHPAGIERILSLTSASPRRSLMIGDRPDRDGEVARRVGMRALIRAPRLDMARDRFRSYADAPFAPLLATASAPASRLGANHA